MLQAQRQAQFTLLLLFHITEMTFRILYLRMCQCIGKDIKQAVGDFMIVPFSLCGVKDT